MSSFFVIIIMPNITFFYDNWSGGLWLGGDLGLSLGSLGSNLGFDVH